LLLPLGLEPGFSRRQTAPKGATAEGERSRRRNTDLIAFVFALVFSSNSPQKTYAKPQNHPSPSKNNSYGWHFSYLQVAILKPVEKKQKRSQQIQQK
jgi:hypothetical protein